MTAVTMTAPSAPRIPGPPQGSWIGYLDGLAHAMVTGPCDARRIVVALPTAELSAAVAAVAAVRHLGELRGAVSLPSVLPEDAGRRVSVFTSGQYRDVVLTAATTEVVSVGGTTLTRYTDVVRRLPDGFPAERPRRRLDARTVAAWALVAGSADPARVHARVAATPIVVIGDHRPFTADLAELEDAWPSVKDLVDSHHDLDRWFRHPVLVCDPGAAPPAWLAQVTPSIVIAVGAAAWRSPLRYALWDAPHLLLLDRRSGAAIDLVDDIRLSNPDTRPLPSEPPRGTEAWGIDEITTATEGVADPDDEDLF